MESAAKVRTLREKAQAAAEKKPARRNRVKILIFKNMKKGFGELGPTPSAVNPRDELVDDVLGDLPPPTRAAYVAALPATIGDEENGDAAPQCCCIQ